MSKQALFDALHFMNMKELRAVCAKLEIPIAQKKVQLIESIMHYLDTGNVLQPEEMPLESKAKKGRMYPLAQNTLIVKGAYTNDLATRSFFKKLVGAHFHFTAYGIDWITERWMKGKPPTYAEFADFWQEEYHKRKKQKVMPKKEWALLTFLQQYQEKHPSASQKEMMGAWKKIREEKVKEAITILKELL